MTRYLARQRNRDGAWRMMVSPEQCLDKAEECARLTRFVETPRMRVALSNVERTWLKLADQCRRLEELIEVIESPAIAPAMESAEYAELSDFRVDDR